MKRNGILRNLGLILILNFSIVTNGREIISMDSSTSRSQKINQYVPSIHHTNLFNAVSGYVAPTVTEHPLHSVQQSAIYSNPLLASYLLSASLGIPTRFTGHNSPQHLPVNPYIALLLSHYGRYVPIHGTGRGIYSYGAANNYHNNKPFGSYKIYEENDS